LLGYALDPSYIVKLRYLSKAIPTLNEELGPSNKTLVTDLIKQVSDLKNDKNTEISDLADDIETDTTWSKNPSAAILSTQNSA
jgi:hypothetical protein